MARAIDVQNREDLLRRDDFILFASQFPPNRPAATAAAAAAEREKSKIKKIKTSPLTAQGAGGPCNGSVLRS